MAIRKFRKNLKPFIWVITLAFLLSLGVGFFGQFKNSMAGASSGIAFKLNKEKVPKIDIERMRNELGNIYTQTLGIQVDRDIIANLVVDETINKYLTLEIAKKIKVSVPSKDIDSEYAKVEKSFPDKEQFSRFLSAQGFTKSTLKLEIENNMLIKAFFAKIKEGINPNDEELKKYFEESSNKFGTLNFETDKQKIKDEYISEKSAESYVSEIEKARKTMKLDDIAKEYQDYIPKPDFEKDGFVIMNTDIARGILPALMQTGGNFEEAKDVARKKYEQQIVIAKIAKDKGINVNQELRVDIQLRKYQESLFNLIKKEIVVDDIKLQKFFNENKSKYNKMAKIDANIAVLSLQPTEDDKNKAKIKAEELLKTLTKDNFADKAKEMSKDPGSAVQGGDLGWFEKGNMVPEFEAVAFSGEVGSIYPKVVQTAFGSHIIYVKEKKTESGKEKVNAAHILITPEVSVEVEKQKLELVANLVEKINKKEIDFKKLKEDNKEVLFSKEIKNIGENGFISELGYEVELTKKMFESEINKAGFEKIEDKIFIYQKTAEQKFEEATLKNLEILENVKSDYITKETVGKMEELYKIEENKANSVQKEIKKP